METIVILLGFFFIGIYLVGKIKNAVSSAKPAAAVIVPRGIRRVSFDYLDQDGNLTTREVTARRYREREGKLYAFCHLRDDDRTFFVDSILGDVVDAKTGELLDKHAWLDTL